VRHWSVALVLACGCGTDPAEPPPPGSPETSRFTPSLCTGGAPGTPTCPYNGISLEPIFAPGASLEFVLKAAGSGVLIEELAFSASTEGLYLERPSFRFWDASDGLAAELTFGETVNLEPGGVATLDTASGGTAAPASRISFRAAVIGPYRP
jgi:hypothetical protein